MVLGTTKTMMNKKTKSLPFGVPCLPGKADLKQINTQINIYSRIIMRTLWGGEKEVELHLEGFSEEAQS